MKASFLRVVTLAAFLVGSVFASAADLADYVTDSTAQPRRDYAAADPAPIQDGEAADEDEAITPVEESNLDIPVIPPRMPTLEDATPVAPGEAAKPSARPKAAEVPSAAKKSAPTSVMAPSRAAQQAAANRATTANYTPANDGTSSVRRTSGFANNPPAAANPRTASAANPYGTPRGPMMGQRIPMNQAAYAQGPRAGQSAVRRASATGQQPHYPPAGGRPYSGVLGSRMVAQSQPTPAPMMDSGETEMQAEPESVEAGEHIQTEGDYPTYGGAADGYPGCGIEGGCGVDAGCGIEGDYGPMDYGPDCGVAGPCYGGCGWYGGADYLYLRARTSDDIAYLRFVEFDDGDDEFTEIDAVGQDFQYESGVRAFFGYRFCDCGGEVVFTYWNYGANSLQQSPEVLLDDEEITFVGAYGVEAFEPGQFLRIDSGIDLNVFDLDYARTFPLGDCNSCCPPWLMRYSIGVRIADLNRQVATAMFDENPSDPFDFSQASVVTTDFSGAGPRVGFEGRRMFCGGCASLFARGSFSLLLGDVDIEARRFEQGIDATFYSRFRESHTRMIPVGDIEVGGSYQITCRVNMSAGYLWQSWWDLGTAPGIGFSELGQGDDAGILSFDGLFVRAEMCF